MDARIIKTKKKIQNTIIELLTKKHLNEISISELCSLANINRNTFYSHYNTTYDVIDDITVNLMEDFGQMVEKSDNDLDISIDICKYLFYKRDIFKNLASSNSDGRYYEIAFAYARKSAQSGFLDSSHKEKRNYLNEFLIGGFVFLLTEWMDKGCVETPEEMGTIIHGLFGKFKI